MPSPPPARLESIRPTSGHFRAEIASRPPIRQSGPSHSWRSALCRRHRARSPSPRSSDGECWVALRRYGRRFAAPLLAYARSRSLQRHRRSTTPSPSPCNEAQRSGAGQVRTQQTAEQSPRMLGVGTRVADDDQFACRSGRVRQAARRSLFTAERTTSIPQGSRRRSPRTSGGARSLRGRSDRPTLIHDQLAQPSPTSPTESGVSVQIHPVTFLGPSYL